MTRSLAIPILLLAACSTRTAPPPDADGAMIYELQNCDNCHGKGGEGKSLGPALRDLGRYWDEDRLSSFLEDPNPFLATDSRLAELRKGFPAAMSRYGNLDESQRRTLARWLLTL